MASVTPGDQTDLGKYLTPLCGVGEDILDATMRQFGGLEFDVVLEARAKDRAVLRLRADLARATPRRGRTFRHRAKTVEQPPDKGFSLEEESVAALRDHV